MAVCPLLHRLEMGGYSRSWVDGARAAGSHHLFPCNGSEEGHIKLEEELMLLEVDDEEEEEVDGATARMGAKRLTTTDVDFGGG